VASHGATWRPTGAADDTLLCFGGSSHRGAVRALNEDSWLAQPPVFVVADGMGGHRAGDAASAIVVERFIDLAGESPVELEAVQDCIGACQREIEALDDGAGPPPGSTLVAAVYILQGDTGYWLVANIGDSRAYVSVDALLEQVTHDHTVVQELIDAGKLRPTDTSSHPERHVVTRALGATDDSSADYSLIPVTGGSTLMLCSDGVSSELDDRTLAKLIGLGLGAQETAQQIVDSAVAAGGHDNATAIVVRVQGPSPRVETLSHIKPGEEAPVPAAVGSAVASSRPDAG
jgi:protein phosphatase